LILNKENACDTSGTFLALEISVVDNKFEHKLYDKRDAFSFYIIRFPYRCSNMPVKMFYSTISAEILRICRASGEYPPFCIACGPFMKRMKSQGAVKHQVRMSLNKLLCRHFREFSKYGKTKEQLVNGIVDLM
jgi:hypothetical protein